MYQPESFALIAQSLLKMHLPPEPNARPPHQPQSLLDRFPGDLIVGVCVLVVFGCCLAMSSVNLARSPQPENPVEGAVSFVALVALLGIVISGIGISLSKKWGFLLALIAAFINVVIAIYSLTIVDIVVAEMAKVSSPKMTESQIESATKFVFVATVLTIALYAGLILYSWLRLSRKVGPRLL